MTASALVARLRRPRTLVLLAILALLIGLRIALPRIVREVAVSQADAALVGRITLDDVDLSLLRGRVTLRGLEVYADELPASGSETAGNAEAPAETPVPAGEPLAKIGSLGVQIGWLPLLRKTVAVEEVQLDDFVVRLDRAQDGALVLPRPVASEAPTEPEPEAEEDAGWGVLIAAVRLTDGLFAFRDFAVDPEPRPFELAIEDVSAGNLRLTMGGAEDEPGRLSLQAKIGPGILKLDSQVTMLAAGPRADSKLVMQDVPIQGTRLYLKTLGWSEVSGALDADLAHLFEAGGAQTASGTIALRDLAITVPEFEGPALAWKRLDVAVAKVDVAGQRAEVSSVGLDGLRVPLRPNEPDQPFPVLHKLLAGSETDGEPANEREENASAPEPSPASEQAVQETGDASWTWSVNEVRVTDATLELLREGQPTPIGLQATLKGLSSDVSATTDVSLDLAPPEGTLSLVGSTVQQPLSFDGKLRVEALSLPKLLAPIDQPVAALLRDGVLEIDLGIAVGPPSNVGEKGARVSGKIGVAGFALGEAEPAGEPFGLAWKSLALDVRELVVPAALGGAAGEPIRATIESIELVEPDLRATRTADGIALPAALGGKADAPDEAAAAPPTASPPDAPIAVPTSEAAPAEAQPANAAPTDAPAAEASTSTPIDVRVARATLTKGRIQVEDRAVRPPYRGDIQSLDLRASGIRWPGPSIDELRVDAKTKEGAKLTVDGRIRPGATELTAKLDGLTLAPFNPYAAGTGYGVGRGAASFESKLSMKGDAYEASSQLVLSELEVTGQQGDALFQQQFGVPLSLALALLTDLDGNISLDIPVSGDREGTSIGLASIVRQALTKAILGAITSPLKMIMAVGSAGEKIDSVTPQAIQFRPGRAEVASGGDELLDRLAALLERSPGLRIELEGHAGPDDERWLREQALRAEIEDSSGFMGSVMNMGELGERDVVMPVLEKRAQDEPAEIPGEVEEWFEARLAEQVVTSDQIAKLAAARADFVRAALVEHGISADRVGITTMDAAAGPQMPEVTLSLGTGSGPSLGAPETDHAGD